MDDTLQTLFITCPMPEDEAAFREMMEECEAFGGRNLPGITRHYAPDFRAFLSLLSRCTRGEGLSPGQVPSTLCVLKNGAGQLFGAISVRHTLTEALRQCGGHIGYGIRPSARGRGLATYMLGLALNEARRMAMQRVLISCDEDNPASARVIEKTAVCWSMPVRLARRASRFAGILLLCEVPCFPAAVRGRA